ncbi:MAG: gamma carbonic anhydrase family protein [Thermoplasmata archaeon]|nr:MAG: gamma carbonic anhydrase family protein [Thermoplasmata archaeon]
MIRSFKGKKPKIARNAIVDESAILIGDIVVGDETCIFPGVIIRATGKKILIEREVAIMDKAFLEAHDDMTIGQGSIISHGAILHGSSVGKNVLVGIGAIVLDVCIGNNAIIGSASLVTKDVGDNEVIMGIPGKVVRIATENDAKRIKEMREDAWNKAQEMNK